VAGAAASDAAASKGAGSYRAEPATLRAAAQRAGIRIGTAVDTTALAEDQTYRQIVAREFSTVTRRT
jgi:endo-1,4-beta-xylanase